MEKRYNGLDYLNDYDLTPLAEEIAKNEKKAEEGKRSSKRKSGGLRRTDIQNSTAVEKMPQNAAKQPEKTKDITISEKHLLKATTMRYDEHVRMGNDVIKALRSNYEKSGVKIPFAKYVTAVLLDYLDLD